jgi:hypothetical protein
VRPHQKLLPLQRKTANNPIRDVAAEVVEAEVVRRTLLPAARARQNPKGSPGHPASPVSPGQKAPKARTHLVPPGQKVKMPALVEVVAAEVVAAVADPALRAKVLPPKAQATAGLPRATAPLLPRAQARVLLVVALVVQLATLPALRPIAGLGTQIPARPPTLRRPQHRPRRPKSRCTFPECHSCLSSIFPSPLSK